MRSRHPLPSPPGFVINLNPARCLLFPSLILPTRPTSSPARIINRKNQSAKTKTAAAPPIETLREFLPLFFSSLHLTRRGARRPGWSSDRSGCRSVPPAPRPFPSPRIRNPGTVAGGEAANPPDAWCMGAAERVRASSFVPSSTRRPWLHHRRGEVRAAIPRSWVSIGRLGPPARGRNPVRRSHHDLLPS